MLKHSGYRNKGPCLRMDYTYQPRSLRSKRSRKLPLSSDTVGYLDRSEGIFSRIVGRPRMNRARRYLAESLSCVSEAKLWLPDVLFGMGVLVGMDAFGGGVTEWFRVNCELKTSGGTRVLVGGRSKFGSNHIDTHAWAGSCGRQKNYT